MQGHIEKKKREEGLKHDLPVEKPILVSSMTEGIIKTVGEFDKKARQQYEKSVAIAKREIEFRMPKKAPQKKAPPKKRPPRPFMDPPKK